jgi:hypothetical protein
LTQGVSDCVVVVRGPKFGRNLSASAPRNYWLRGVALHEVSSQQALWRSRRAHFRRLY